jgi:DNA-directed RNA polymerase specialized sigma24 family protein
LSALPDRRPQRIRPRKQQAQHRLAPSEVERLAQQYVASASMKVLAERWGPHRTTVAGHLRRDEVALRRQEVPTERLDEASRLYGEGWSCQRLAERCDCDEETVREDLERSGVRLRSPWER